MAFHRKGRKELIKVLQEASRSNVLGRKFKVFIGGSVGQRTAVPGHRDLDLVLYFNKMPYTYVIEEGYENLKRKLQEYLGKSLLDKYCDPDETEVAIKFRYRLPNEKFLEVDVLFSPYWETEKKFLEDMAEIEPPEERFRLFSVSASRFQRCLIRKQGVKVRELIKRMKVWRNETWGEDAEGRPKSYLLSMLVIEAYSQVEDEDGSLPDEVARKLQDLVINIATDPKLRLYITSPEHPHNLMEDDLIEKPPVIVDPVNPTNNLYKSGVGPDPYGPGGGRWERFKKKAHTIDLTERIDLDIF